MEKMDEMIEKLEKAKIAVTKANKILKKGDRVRATKCPNTERTFTFDHWDGCWMVSTSGINDYHPINIKKINGVAWDG